MLNTNILVDSECDVTFVLMPSSLKGKHCSKICTFSVLLSLRQFLETFFDRCKQQGKISASVDQSLYVRLYWSRAESHLKMKIINFFFIYILRHILLSPCELHYNSASEEVDKRYPLVEVQQHVCMPAFDHS